MLATTRARSGIAFIVGAIILMTPLAAQATDQTSTSSPTGRLTVRSATLSLTNVDGDGNPDTATNGDVVQLVGSVANNTASTQKVRITVSFDLPGTRLDVAVSKRVPVAGGKTEQVSLNLKIFRFFPRGAYTTSITAADGTESATATSSLSLN